MQNRLWQQSKGFTTSHWSPLKVSLISEFSTPDAVLKIFGIADGSMSIEYTSPKFAPKDYADETKGFVVKATTTGFALSCDWTKDPHRLHEFIDLFNKDGSLDEIKEILAPSLRKLTV